MQQISTKRALKRHARPILAGLLAGLTLIVAQKALANPAVTVAQPLEITDEHLAREARTCARPIGVQERLKNIPKGLLGAVALAESGRWNDTRGENVAWPWTVTTGGTGYYLPSRVDAVAFVKALQAGGVENIDVGCMQINLKYHPDAFAGIEQAFDPAANAAYAANFLRERFAVTHSWIEAAGQYHSTTPNLNRKYKDKVVKLWQGTARTQIAGATPATVTRPDRDLTQRFNAAFRARRTGGIASGAGGIASGTGGIASGTGGAAYSATGQALVNRYQAQQALLSAPSAPNPGAFAAKRQAQLQAWRMDHGHLGSATR